MKKKKNYIYIYICICPPTSSGTSAIGCQGLVKSDPTHFNNEFMIQKDIDYKVLMTNPILNNNKYLICPPCPTV